MVNILETLYYILEVNATYLFVGIANILYREKPITDLQHVVKIFVKKIRIYFDRLYDFFITSSFLIVRSTEPIVDNSILI